VNEDVCLTVNEISTQHTRGPISIKSCIWRYTSVKFCIEEIKAMTKPCRQSARRPFKFVIVKITVCPCGVRSGLQQACSFPRNSCIVPRPVSYLHVTFTVSQNVLWTDARFGSETLDGLVGSHKKNQNSCYQTYFLTYTKMLLPLGSAAPDLSTGEAHSVLQTS